MTQQPEIRVLDLQQREPSQSGTVAIGRNFRRRLAAIAFADVVGYCAHMQADEIGTLRRLDALGRSVIEPAVAAHGGRVVRRAGDAWLVEFAAALDAVACMSEVQETVTRNGAQASEEPAILLRVGIEVGDVVDHEGDVFGDCVNLAERLQRLSLPGGVATSRTVLELIAGRSPAVAVPIGRLILKGYPRRREVFRLSGFAPDTATSPRRSLTKRAWTVADALRRASTAFRAHV